VLLKGKAADVEIGVARNKKGAVRGRPLKKHFLNFAETASRKHPKVKRTKVNGSGLKTRHCLAATPCSLAKTTSTTHFRATDRVH
jgi:hypothetical protein